MKHDSHLSLIIYPSKAKTTSYSTLCALSLQIQNRNSTLFEPDYSFYVIRSFISLIRYDRHAREILRIIVILHALHLLQWKVQAHDTQVTVYRRRKSNYVNVYVLS